MKRILLILAFSVFFITSSVQAQTIKVTALEDFSSENPKPSFSVQTIQTEILGDFFLEAKTIISGQVIKVNKPKRGKRNSCFDFKPTAFTCNEKTIDVSQTEILGIILGYEPINTKELAFKITKKTANFFLKGLITAAEFGQGFIQAENGQRLKSGATKVYKESFFCYIEIGNELNIEPGDILILKLKAKR